MLQHHINHFSFIHFLFICAETAVKPQANKQTMDSSADAALLEHRKKLAEV